MLGLAERKTHVNVPAPGEVRFRRGERYRFPLRSTPENFMQPVGDDLVFAGLQRHRPQHESMAVAIGVGLNAGLAVEQKVVHFAGGEPDLRRIPLDVEGGKGAAARRGSPRRFTR